MNPSLIFVAIIGCACLVLADKIEKNGSLADETDVIDVGTIEEARGDKKSQEAQRKRDSGYSYTRPEKNSLPQRHELVTARGRIVTKRPNGQTVRPFERYGPPRYRPQSIGQRYRPNQQNELHISVNDFSRGQNSPQKVPSPIRDYEFVEPSPIAGQNSIPFNSNAANYLPPRNQKLPGYSNPNNGFVNRGHPGLSNAENGGETVRNHNGHQSFNGNDQSSQKLVQESLHRHQQISDAAAFLSQNSQAISQLYEAPAVNLNYEPIYDVEGSVLNGKNPTSNFQNFGINEAVTIGSSGLHDSRQFHSNLPSYASGLLNRDTLVGIQSLEKDRLINQLQHALVDARGEQESTGANRYAQNHDNPEFIKIQSTFGSQHAQINSAPGPQLDRPNNNPSFQRPYASSSFATASVAPVANPTTSGYTYGLPSTTPANLPSLSSIPHSTTIATSTQRPNQVINAGASTQTSNSLPPPGITSTTFQIPQFGGFVPSLIGTNYFSNYPTYATNFLGSDSSVINHVQSTSPTHFAIPIPTIPLAQGPTNVPSNPSPPQKPDSSSGQHPHATPVQPIPIQPINPISAGSPLHPTIPLVPAATPVNSFENPATSANLPHPTYGLQSTILNPLFVKPVKPIYPLYYYPNVYNQFQKPLPATLPWSYAPSFTQTRPVQAWK